MLEKVVREWLLMYERVVDWFNLSSFLLRLQPSWKPHSVCISHFQFFDQQFTGYDMNMGVLCIHFYDDYNVCRSKRKPQ